jgi:dTDP-4-amino-4,6-dideoxygalactose transaminase
MKVSFLDLHAQYETIKDEIHGAVHSVLESCAFAGGPFVEKFEREWASYCGVRDAVGVGSGTEALWLILRALGIGDGDEVITVPNTFFATAEAISMVGAVPVLVDVEESHYTVDPSLLAEAITSKTKAIIIVHLFGQMADMDPIMEVSQAHGIPVIEDACQAHGAEYKGYKAGSIGRAAAFSFYPGKNLGAYGEAGAVTTNDDALAQAVRILRDHGQSRKYYHTMIGWNARMDGLQASILSAKLLHLDEWNTKRRRIARLYQECLGQCAGITLPAERADCTHIYHIFAVRVKERDRVLSELGRDGISCGIHYPVPVHLQSAYSDSHIRVHAAPIAEKCAHELLSLPMYPELPEAQVVHVAKILCEKARLSLC